MLLKRGLEIGSANIRGGVEDIRLEAKDTKKIRGQGQGQPVRGQNLSRPRPRTAFARTDPLEAKDRNARGQSQGPRTQAQAFSKKKKRSSKIFFKRSPVHWRSQNF